MGCVDDGYEINVNGTIYRESNPSGIQTINTNSVCDSVIQIDLQFAENSSGSFEHTTCSQSGYEITINSTTYDESNPIGEEVLVGANSCDSTVMISLDFLPIANHLINDFYCSGSGAQVIVNGTTYNESNPVGTETLLTSYGCDSIVEIDLFYFPITTTPINYSGCFGDGYFINVDGTIYDELNPMGTEFLTNSLGCDSIVSINLIFSNSYERTESYMGCIGDGYSISVNDVIYDEDNPIGIETLLNPLGCDTVVTINLNYSNEISQNVTYSRCVGDGYSISVNDSVYDELNPTGIQRLVSSGGCDSVVTINLEFTDEIRDSIRYIGCLGDGYSVIVNDIEYNETNLTGTERMTSSAGCDSVVSIELEFNSEINENESHVGCQGDGFTVSVNNVLYNEGNPSGTERMTTSSGCDSIVTINLDFSPTINETANYTGCFGDGYNITVNNILYDEDNPNGIEQMTSASGCDSIVTINLEFNAGINELEDYSGCLNDGYSVIVNNILYDESNPTGIEQMTSASGCDSIVTINLEFNSEINEIEDYSGCLGDGYNVTVNNILYNESNPLVSNK